LYAFVSSAGCCKEESSWGGALSIIGRESEIGMVGLVWQGWPCHKGMHNLLLTNNSDLCIQLADSSSGAKGVKGVKSIQHELLDAASRKQLFARKFASSDHYWMDWIKANLHNKNIS
jgi:hypothetical protein